MNVFSFFQNTFLDHGWWNQRGKGMRTGIAELNGKEKPGWRMPRGENDSKSSSLWWGCAQVMGRLAPYHLPELQTLEMKGISRSHQKEQSWRRDWFKLVWNFKYLPLTPGARTFILHPQVWTEYKCLLPKKNESQPPSIAKDGGQVPLRKNEVNENLVHNTPS